MKFIEVVELFDTFRDDKMNSISTPVYVNVEQIDLIRESAEGNLSVFLSGRDKAIKLVDEKSIKVLKKAVGIASLKESK